MMLGVGIYSGIRAMPLRRAVSTLLQLAALACVLLWPCTARADQHIRADFDGDGQLDNAQQQPAGVVVWLSRSRVFSVLRGSPHPVQLAAVDIDHDGRPELVALDAATGLHVWKAHKSGKLHRYHQTRGSPGPSVHASRCIGDDPDGIEAREPAPEREAASLVALPHDTGNNTTRTLPQHPGRDPRTGCSRFTAPRAPPTLTA
jgi:hypothetical protein